MEFGHVFAASGVQGFFGEGYWYHPYVRPIGMNFDGMTFVSKTTTLSAREGNMKDGEMFPKCVVVKPFKSIALNSVGLRGPGAATLFADGRWQERTEPFLISFMSIADTAEKRIDEFRQFCQLLLIHISQFKTPFGLQVNVSCPNVGLDTAHLLHEVKEYARLVTLLIPYVAIMVKVNAVVSVRAALELSQINGIDALCVSNTIPWGKLPDQIDWVGLFGSDVSPLAQYGFGNGGLSGAPLLPIVEKWVKAARDIGITIPINAGGGILSHTDAERLITAGADSVFIGSMAFLRPWRVSKTVRHINKLMNKES